MTSAFQASRFHDRARAVGLELPPELVFWSAVTESTNDDALAAARGGAPAGTTFIADHQTRGRGRRGQAWHDEAASSLLFSTIVRPHLSLNTLPCLSLAAGVGVRRAIGAHLPAVEALGRVQIKWPNDVWIDGKKVAGILIENQLEGAAHRAAVIGVGVNVGATQFPDGLRDTATSVSASGGQVTREELLADILRELFKAVSDLARGGFAVLHADVTRYDALYGKRVGVDALRGVARGIDGLGRLVIDTGAHLVPVSSGSVRLER